MSDQTSDPGQLLQQNPLLGGGLLAVAVALLGVLLRVILKSDTRWERLNDAQSDQLDHTIQRLAAAEARVDAAEARAIAAAREVEELRRVHERDQRKCEAVQREVERLKAEVARLKNQLPGG